MGTKKKRLQLIILALALIVAVLIVAANRSSGSKYPAVGDAAPDFQLMGLDGSMHRLSDFKGKTVLLNFWGSYCQPCREEMPAIQRESEKWAAQGAVVLGVNIGENRVTAQGFVDQIGVKFTNVLDEQEEVRRRYGVKDYPTTFFIGPDGKIKLIKVGWMQEDFIDNTFADLLAPGKGAKG